MHCDIKSAIRIMNYPAYHDRTKHVEPKVDCHFTREKIEKEEIKLRYGILDDQLVDVLTKAVVNKKLSDSLSKLVIVNIYMHYLEGEYKEL